MNGQIKAKVTPRFDYDRSRPPSPLKSLPTSPSPTPGARPRAKVNSSATIGGARKPVASTSSHSLTATAKSTTSAPRVGPARAPSPFKPTQAQATNSPSTTAQVKARITTTARVTVATAASPPTAPELRQRALTSTDISARSRRGSISSHVSSSHSSAPSRNIYSPPRLAPTSSNEENHSGSSSVVSSSGVGQIKVRSRVTRIAEHGAQPTPSLPPSPSFPPHTRPTRVPSVSSLSLSPPLDPTKPSRANGLSPISTSGHGRYATTREASSPKASPFRAFAALDDSAVGYAAGRVDPAQIPLPPQSPQMSAVSFSSRSSLSLDSRASETSGSTAPALHHRANGVNGATHARARSSVDALGFQHSPPATPREESAGSASPVLGSEEDDRDVLDDESVHSEEDSDRKMRKEAISNRKIADLEITNKSLLAINSSLEATKHRQAKEIRDLRRKLRESILVLPPPAYRAAKSSLATDNTLEDEVEEDDPEEEEEAVIEGTTDEAYKRVKSIIEALLESGRKALETTPDDFKSPGKGITKVLSEEEARTWRGEDESLVVDRDDLDDATDDGQSRPLTPSRIAIPSDTSEEEVEKSLLLDEDALAASLLPPITVTPSPSP